MNSQGGPGIWREAELFASLFTVEEIREIVLPEPFWGIQGTWQRMSLKLKYLEEAMVQKADEYRWISRIWRIHPRILRELRDEVSTNSSM